MPSWRESARRQVRSPTGGPGGGRGAGAVAPPHASRTTRGAANRAKGKRGTGDLIGVNCGRRPNIWDPAGRQTLVLTYARDDQGFASGEPASEKDRERTVLTQSLGWLDLPAVVGRAVGAATAVGGPHIRARVRRRRVHAGVRNGGASVLAPPMGVSSRGRGHAGVGRGAGEEHERRDGEDGRERHRDLDPNGVAHPIFLAGRCRRRGPVIGRDPGAMAQLRTQVID